ASCIAAWSCLLGFGPTRLRKVMVVSWVEWIVNVSIVTAAAMRFGRFALQDFMVCRAGLIRGFLSRSSACVSSASWPGLEVPLRSPRGAPDPAAPPCIRHRRLSFTAGARQLPPARVRAPHLGTAFNRAARFGCVGLSIIFAGPLWARRIDDAHSRLTA